MQGQGQSGLNAELVFSLKQYTRNWCATFGSPVTSEFGGVLVSLAMTMVI